MSLKVFICDGCREQFFFVRKYNIQNYLSEKMSRCGLFLSLFLVLGVNYFIVLVAVIV